MNKKQLIILWTTGILLCIVFLPLQLEKRRGSRWRVVSRLEGYQRVVEELKEVSKELKDVAKELEARRYATQKSLIILIIGGLLIYSLRDKKE